MVACPLTLGKAGFDESEKMKGMFREWFSKIEMPQVVAKMIPMILIS